MSAVAAASSSRIGSGREACCRSSNACGVQAAASRRPDLSRRCTMQRHASSSSSSSGSISGRGSRSRLSPRAAAEAEAPQQAGALVPDRQGYRSFQLDGCEFLIAETPDGRLDLRDAYVARQAQSGEPNWQRVEGVQLTPQPQAYHEVPFYSEYEGDLLEDKPGKVWVWRWYLVPIAAREPEMELRFEDIYVLDGKTASLAPCEVVNLAPAGTPQRDLVLRIRDEVVTIDTVPSLPDFELAAQARLQGIPGLSQLEMERLQQYMAALEAAKQAGTISQEEFQAAYDDMDWLVGLRAGGAGAEAIADSHGAYMEVAGAEVLDATTQEDDIMGGWDEEAIEDLLPQYDDESEETEFEEFDSPASDY